MNREYRIVKVDNKNLPKLKDAILRMNLETIAHAPRRNNNPSSGAIHKIDKVMGGYLVYHRGEVVGWGAHFRSDCEAHIFTHRSHRRHGIGTRLVERFKKDYPELLFCPWHRRVQGFFNKRGVNYSRAYLPL